MPARMRRRSPPIWASAPERRFNWGKDMDSLRLSAGMAGIAAVTLLLLLAQLWVDGPSLLAA